MPHKDPEVARAYRREWKKSPEQRAKAAQRARQHRKDDPDFRKRESEAGKRWRASHPETVQATNKRNNKRNAGIRRDHALRSNYGITIEDYERMFEEQKGACAICGSVEVRRNGRTNFCVDHCHKTGKVRGLLCNECNVGLGRLGDDAESLRRALAYLERFE